MLIISYLLAGLIVLVRVYVPISMTVAGGWPVRLLLFGLWLAAVIGVGGKNLGQFFSALKARWLELACYLSWIAILGGYCLIQGGEHFLTNFLFNGYIGTIPYYFLGAYYSGEDSRGRYMACLISIVVGISCLLAIPIVWRDPTLVRAGAIVMDTSIRAQSIGSYGDLTGFAIALPFFITASLQNKHLLRIAGLAGCLATIGLMMIATLSGLIVLTSMAVAGCILYYMVLGGFRLHRIVLSIVAVGAIVWVSGSVFPQIYERPEIRRFYDKITRTLDSISGILKGEERDPTQRWSLMLDSWNVFIANPVFGVASDAKGAGTEGTGGHSSFVDALANYGLFGSVPYLLFHVLVFRRLWKVWRSDRKNGIYWGSLLCGSLYIFYSFINVTSQSTTVALFLYASSASVRLTPTPAAASGGRAQVPAAPRRPPVPTPPKEKKH